MNSNMVKSEKFDHFHLVYQFTVPLRSYSLYTQFMLILILIEVQHLQIVVFSFEKG